MAANGGADLAAPDPAGDAVAADPADVTSSPQSLHSAVHARRSDYVRPHRIRVKIGSWNVAACPGTDKDLASWFVDGKGVDRRLATVDVSHNPAIEREDSADSLDADPNAVRLVGGDKVGLYVLGLQEVEDLNVATSYVARVVYSDSGLSPEDRWKMALEAALPPGYEAVASQQMSGLLLLVYAAPEVAASISNVSVSTVGTGLLGYLGNKGAVSARIVLGETTRMTFVNCHLASGHDSQYLERRIWDVGQILSRTQFEPVSHHGAPPGKPEKIGDEDFIFWFGDLNFRLDGLPGDDIRRLLTLHTKGEYDLSKKPLAREEALGGDDVIVVRGMDNSSDTQTEEDNSRSSKDSQRTRSTVDQTSGGDGNDSDSSVSLPDPDEFLPDPSDDPASLQATLDSLLPHDQLRRLIKQGKVFHDGWREGPITFLPSYKYDVGTVGLFDTSEKKRAPSWCDRILYRTRRDKEAHEKKVREAEEARKRDTEMKTQGLDNAVDDDEILFESYDPDTDGDDPPASGDKSPKPPAKDYDYDYDEGNDADANEDADAGSAEEVVTKEGFVDRIHLDIYTSHQRIQSSDHKPIISVFSLDYDGAVPELKAKVHAEVARELDRAENEGRPAVTLVMDAAEADREDTSSSSASQLPGSPIPIPPSQSPGSPIPIPPSQSPGSPIPIPPSPSPRQTVREGGEAVDFGRVSFLGKKTRSMTIANTGRVVAKFSFVEKPTTEEENFGALVPRWLTTSFIRTDLGGQQQQEDAEVIDLGKEVALEPGETVKASVDIFVDDIAQATKLNDGQATLDDVLVLRVVGGRDHFLPIRAVWNPTCIGRSMDELIRVPDGGIRAFVETLAEQRSKEQRKHGGGKAPGGTVGSIPYDLEVRFSAPKELFKLTEAVEVLTERALADEQMLEGRELPRNAPGWPLADPPRARPELVAAVIEMLDRDRPLAEAFEPETPSSDRLEAVTEVLLLFLRGLTDGIITIPLWTRIEQAALPSLSHALINSNVAVPITASGGGRGSGPSQRQEEDDKAAILDILASAPNHNISFVFLTTTLSKVLSELAPLSKADVEALRSTSLMSSSSSAGGTMGTGRRSLSFLRSGPKAAAEALAALEKRQAKERRFAEILARAGVCRAPVSVKGKERKAVEDKQRAVLELFLRRSRHELL